MNKQEIEKAIQKLVIVMQCWSQQTQMDEDTANAFKLAISALEHQLTNEWIPCIEKYPEEGERVIVWDILNHRVAIAYFSCPHWEADDGRITVNKWQPLPPCTETQKEDADAN